MYGSVVTLTGICRAPPHQAGFSFLGSFPVAGRSTQRTEARDSKIVEAAPLVKREAAIEPEGRAAAGNGPLRQRRRAQLDAMFVVKIFARHTAPHARGPVV
jgi:hypothetical protein